MDNQINSKTHLLNISQLVLAIIILFWLNSGIFSYVLPFVPNFLKAIIVLLWFLLALSVKGFLQKFVLKSRMLVLFIAICLIATTIYSNEILQMWLQNLLYLLIIYAIWLFYSKDDQNKRKRIILVALSIDMVWVGINTAIQLQLNPLLARHLSTSLTTKQQIFGNIEYYAVGGYGFVYGLIILMLLLLFRVISSKKRKVLDLVMFFAAVGIILESQFTIAILFAGAFAAILLSRVFIKTRNYLFFVVTLVCLIALWLFSQNIIKIVSESSFIHQEVSIRINEMLNAMAYNSADEGDLGSRLGFYAISMNSFFSNVLYGTFGSGGIGGHSTMFDLLGLFGLLSLLFISFIYATTKEMWLSLSGNRRVVMKVLLVYYFCFAILNNAIFGTIFICLFIFAPFTLSLMEQVAKGEKIQ